MSEPVKKWARLPGFWSRVDLRGPGECWPWLGALQGAGYGDLSGALAHRTAYELTREPIPEGMTIDHLCRNRRCCNPSHMEVVTRAENGRRGERNRLTRSGGRHLSSRTHCKWGHEFTPENTRIQKPNSRICRTCAARRIAEFKARRAA